MLYYLKNMEPLVIVIGISVMNLFNSLQVYAEKWSLKESRGFTQEEVASVERAEVVSSQYGNSVCFFRVGGGQSFIPLDQNSSLGVGEEVNLATAKLLTLGKSGERDIYRVKA